MLYTSSDDVCSQGATSIEEMEVDNQEEQLMDSIHVAENEVSMTSDVESILEAPPVRTDQVYDPMTCY